MSNARTRPAERGDIADQIAMLIRTRAFGPGEHLREQVLADRFGVSRGPVREALNRLSASGLVRLEPGRGAIVPRLDDVEVVANSEASGVLMGVVARRAARRATPDEHAALLEALSAMESAIAAGTVSSDTFVDHAQKLIRILLRAGGSESLRRVVDDVLCRGPALIWQPFSVLTAAQQRSRARDWRRVVEAVTAGKVAVAERAAVSIQQKELVIALKHLGMDFEDVARRSG